jgi:Flp pilus assembly protein TadD
MLAKRGDTERAEVAYGRGLEIDRDWVPAYVNLADLFRQTGRDDEGEKLLRAALGRLPDAAALHHSLGLLLVRERKLDAALGSLARAAELAPDDARFSYVYAVGLDSAGRKPEARDAVAAALRRMPGDPSLNALRAQLANDRER